MPAAGKTTLAREFAARLGAPLVERDEIKETLFDSLGPATSTGRGRSGRPSTH